MEYIEEGVGGIVSFGEYLYDLTDKTNWEGYISGKIFNANMRLNREILERFRLNYECLGRMTYDGILKNQDIIRGRLNQKTLLVLFLGSELKYSKNKQAAYEDRHEYH